jgi:putative redox protein
MDLITVTRKTGLEFAIRVRGHVITSDMSAAEGGRDAGPNPVELLACSVGSCIATMVQGYCNEHGYTNGDVGVSLTLELATDPKRIAALVVDVELPQGMPDGVKQDVKRMIDGFPVPVTLCNPPQLDVEVS